MFDGFLGGAHGLLQHAAQDPAYPQWLEKHRATANDVRRQRDLVASWEHPPLIGLVCVVRNDAERDLTRGLLRSLVAQSYGRYELALVTPADDDPALRALVGETFGADDDRVRVLNADGDGIADWTNAGVCAVQGDYIGFLTPDMVLEPDMLYRYAAAVLPGDDGDAEPADLLYCDEDRLVDGRYADPLLKPGLNPDLLYAGNYVGSVLMVSRGALERMALPDAAVADAYTYDLALQGAEGGAVRHVPYVLVHRRSGRGGGQGALEAGRVALERHWARMKVDATVSVDESAAGDASVTARYRTAYAHAEGKAPKVSVVIPTKDNVPLLRTCLDAVFANTDYPDFDVTVVENNSTEPETFRYYEELEADDRPVRVVRWPGKGFNYSAICNYGAAQCDGELLLFLNNDTEVIERGWMASMAGLFARPEVGVVGAKLLYRDGLVQHGGVWVVSDGCEYINQNFNRDAAGYMGTLRFAYDAAAVTGACQMIRRSVFERIGGFDEELAVAFNDVDLCLRAEDEGVLAVFDPDALLYHNEYGTRGRDGMNPKGRARIMGEESRFRARWVNFPEGEFIGANLVQRDGHFKLQW
nr:glycosyltransferase family 2 protein [Bifidobacterium sp. DSM 109958]